MGWITHGPPYFLNGEINTMKPLDYIVTAGSVISAGIMVNDLIKLNINMKADHDAGVPRTAKSLLWWLLMTIATQVALGDAEKRVVKFMKRS